MTDGSITCTCGQPLAWQGTPDRLAYVLTHGEPPNALTATFGPEDFACAEPYIVPRVLYPEDFASIQRWIEKLHIRRIQPRM
jgi:hypothetical protein